MKTINITLEVHSILSSVQALEGKFGAGYVNRLLRADEKFPVREKHMALPTYGVLKEIPRDRLRGIINYLVLNRYLSVSTGEYPVIAPTLRGIEVLANQATIDVPYRDLNAANSDYALMETLRMLRVTLSSKRSIAPHHIFTDAAMEDIVRRKPETLEALAATPGLTLLQVEAYGEMIVETIKQDVEARKTALQEQLEQRAASAKGQMVKSLHESGLSVDGIAAKMNIKRGIAEYYLEALHVTGQINLVNWVATNLNEQPALNMGVAYFRKWRDARLTEAQQALGLDFYTLRLCRWYALAA